MLFQFVWTAILLTIGSLWNTLVAA